MGGKDAQGRRRRPGSGRVPRTVDWEESRRRYVAEMIALGALPAEAEAEAARKVERRRLEWGRERLALLRDAGAGRRGL